MWQAIVVSWTKRAITQEQLMVLRNVAARALLNESNPVVNFSHELCEGHITRDKVGVIGIFRGMIFTADLGTVDGERWTVTFLVPRGTEHLPIPRDAKIISTSTLPGRRPEVSEVDMSQVGGFNPDEEATHAGATTLQ